MVGPSAPSTVPAAGDTLSAVTTFTSNSTSLFQMLDRGNAPKGYAWVELTALGNQALALACFTATQRQVWTWPSYEFLIKTKVEDGISVPAIKVSQLQTCRPSYVNALLIASRGWVFDGRCISDPKLYPFAAPPGMHVRLPGTWDGACANCKWKDLGAQCSFRNPDEPQFVPLTAIAPPPVPDIQRIVDADDNDGDGDNGN